MCAYVPVCSQLGNVGLSLIISFAEPATEDVKLSFICDTRAALNGSGIDVSVALSV